VRRCLDHGTKTLYTHLHVDNKHGTQCDHVSFHCGSCAAGVACDIFAKDHTLECDECLLLHSAPEMFGRLAVAVRDVFRIEHAVAEGAADFAGATAAVAAATVAAAATATAAVATAAVVAADAAVVKTAAKAANTDEDRAKVTASLATATSAAATEVTALAACAAAISAAEAAGPVPIYEVFGCVYKELSSMAPATGYVKAQAQRYHHHMVRGKWQKHRIREAEEGCPLETCAWIVFDYKQKILDRWYREASSYYYGKKV
jgi:hypothetical protein